MSGQGAPLNLDGWSSLLDPSPTNQVRLPVFGSPSMVDFYVDLGGYYPVDTVALINTSLLTAGAQTFSVMGYLDPPLSTMEATLPTAYFSASTLLSGTWRAAVRGQAVVALISSAQYVRYVRITVFTNDPYVDIGTVVVGGAWRPTYNFDQGYMKGRNDLGIRETAAQTGVSFNYHGAKLRVYQFSMSMLSPTDVAGILDQLDTVAGATRDVLFVPDDGLSYSDQARDTIYGSCRPVGESLSSQFFPSLLQRTFKVTERL